jgi:hypothetical protein
MLKEFNCICTIAANGLEGYNEYVKKHYVSLQTQLLTQLGLGIYGCSHAYP